MVFRVVLLLTSCESCRNQKFKMSSNTIDPNLDSSSAGRRKDPAWKYHSLVNPKDLNTFKCNFCGKLTKGGVYRAKQHLAGGYRNVEICSKCPPHVRDEIIEFMSKKKRKNDFDDMPDFDDIDTLGDDVDEMDVGAFQNRGKRPMQGQASSMQQKKQRQQQKGPLDLFLSTKPKVSNQKDAKGKQTTIESHVNKELRENACVWFSRWMYEAGIPFNAVNYPSFKPMMEAIGRVGPGMKPPSFHEVRVPYLKKEVEHTKEIMKSHREEWARYGCTIMCDGWKDKRDRSLLNFLVNSPKGSVFIESIDTSSYAKDGMKLYQLLDRFVEDIGETNVVQVVTDNASANVLAGEFLMTKHKNLYWTPCAAHCLDLMLEDIFKIPRLKSTFQKACSVNGYLYSFTQVLNMMRSFTQKREMLRPGKTRFATAFLTLSRFHKQKANLRKMFTSEEWTNSRFAKETRGKQAAQTVLQESFWKNILFALKVSEPLVKVLRVVDNEDKPAMPYIYEAMDRAKEAIAKSFDDERKYEKIFEIIDERWNVQLHRPLHAVGYYLNPEFFYSNESIREDNEVIEGLYACIERLLPTAEVQDKLSKELSFYKNSEGLFGKQICIRGRNQLSLGNTVF
ncbi:uncharacterized protein LOC127787936 [Diospyros lotus]|uniref:uncharacterized protein LOC127787936 n=1 Tax=Diospyros lotus TaxID=55363 RepID=UPI0022545242|nr:uncharacterized protein LOC127787936 [Diospyros lotus]